MTMSQKVNQIIPLVSCLLLGLMIGHFAAKNSAPPNLQQPQTQQPQQQTQQPQQPQQQQIQQPQQQPQQQETFIVETPFQMALMGLTRMNAKQLEKATEGMLSLTRSVAPPTTPPFCNDDTGCVRELFAQLYVSLSRGNLIPLIWDPSIRDGGHRHAQPEAELGNAVRSSLHAQPFAFERVMLDHYNQEARKMLEEYKKAHQNVQCMEWGTHYLDNFWEGFCTDKWDFVFDPSNPRRSGRQIYGDLTDIKPEVLAPGSMDLVLSTQVFEHVPDPFASSKHLFNIVKPGGYVLWSAPFFYPHHNLPHDYFRYTFYGAEVVAKAGGFEIVAHWSPGPCKVMYAYLLGKTFFFFCFFLVSFCLLFFSCSFSFSFSFNF